MKDCEVWDSKRLLRDWFVSQVAAWVGMVSDHSGGKADCAHLEPQRQMNSETADKINQVTDIWWSVWPGDQPAACCLMVLPGQWLSSQKAVIRKPSDLRPLHRRLLVSQTEKPRKQILSEAQQRSMRETESAQARTPHAQKKVSLTGKHLHFLKRPFHPYLLGTYYGETAIHWSPDNWGRQTG